MRIRHRQWEPSNDKLKPNESSNSLVIAKLLEFHQYSMSIERQIGRVTDLSTNQSTGIICTILEPLGHMTVTGKVIKPEIKDNPRQVSCPTSKRAGDGQRKTCFALAEKINSSQFQWTIHVQLRLSAFDSPQGVRQINCNARYSTAE